MRIWTIAAICAATAACSPAEQHKTQAQARAAGAEVKAAVSEVAHDPQVKAAGTEAKEAVKTAGTQIKEAAKTTAAKIKEAGTEAKQNTEAAGDKTPG